MMKCNKQTVYHNICLLTPKINIAIMYIVHVGRDVRVVYGAGLENQRRVTASEGSNPSLSSILIIYQTE